MEYCQFCGHPSVNCMICYCRSDCEFCGYCPHCPTLAKYVERGPIVVPAIADLHERVQEEALARLERNEFFWTFESLVEHVALRVAPEAMPPVVARFRDWLHREELIAVLLYREIGLEIDRSTMHSQKIPYKGVMGPAHLSRHALHR